VSGIATSVEDVTERIRLDAELEDTRRALAEQNEALRRSNRDLQQFAYIASHDLSEPLRVMTGYVQLLERRYCDALDDKGRRWIGHVVDGSSRMRQLIDDLLEYSRFLGSDRTIEVVDLDAAARSTAERALRDVVGGTVDVHPLPPVRADSSAVHSVLANLIGNALKFSAAGRAPRAVVSAAADRGMVRLMVDDDGIGIELQYRERVFRMFQRLHAREEYSGTGIGLAIVQQVAESHGGRAWVEDSPLGGARFCVTLPAAPVVAAVTATVA
jgi:light-regulated signal transduction histidine kinase (bacteriophytochrome)